MSTATANVSGNQLGFAGQSGYFGSADLSVARSRMQIDVLDYR
jgi:hypothetical protein